MLLNYGANATLRTDWGDTAAHYAAFSGTIDNLKFVMEEGASLSKPNSDGTAKKLCEKFGLSEARKDLKYKKRQYTPEQQKFLERYYQLNASCRQFHSKALAFFLNP